MRPPTLEADDLNDKEEGEEGKMAEEQKITLPVYKHLRLRVSIFLKYFF